MKSLSMKGHLALACGISLNLAAGAAWADNENTNICQTLGIGKNPQSIYSQLKSALDAAVQAETSGLDLNMWATLVARDGTVCAVARSAKLGDQWPGSRVISAQKANAANAFSLPPTNSSVFPQGLSLSTANLYSAVQPGGSLFGLQHSNPVDTGAAYKGPSNNWGTANDPLVGEKVGGVNVFGGGLALYDASHQVVGAVGLSGDTSCADHFIAWRVRNSLGLDHLAGVGGVSGDLTRPDNIVFDIAPNGTTPPTVGAAGISAGGFGHPTCIRTGDPSTLPAVQ